MRSARRELWACCAALLLAASLGLAADKAEILPLDQVKPGMRGVVYTIFEGDQIEKIDLEVIGVMPNLMGPKQHIILVRLLGPKAEYTGVVAGMSGSPVYIEGKLAGALSLKFGFFTKEALAGVTPIENVLEVERAETSAQRASAEEGWDAAKRQYPLPAEMAQRVGAGSGAYLTPIETPLVFSGFHPAVIQRFADQLTAYGMVATQGGTAEPRPDDAELKAGDMASMALVQGDLSLQAGCTVTALVDNRVFVCGHPLFGFGSVELPLARGRVLTTMASSFFSAKLMNAGGVIGTVTQDRLTAVMGRLGAPPRLIPVELAIATPAQTKQFRFEVIQHPKLTPLLVAISTFNGLVANTAYSEGTTFQLTGGISIQGHATVNLENMFAPTDLMIPDGFFVALAVQGVFNRIFTNPYENAQIEKVALRIEAIPERRWATIESAWSEKSEVTPGEALNVKVLLRPYRGAPFIREVPITIPPQATKGSLRLLISDGDTLNRMSRFISFGTPTSAGRLAGLEQLITLLNRERRNNRLYVTLLQPNPTLLLEDKELPNAPVSQINVLDQRRGSSGAVLLRESTAGEWSVLMNQVITGQHTLTITVK